MGPLSFPIMVCYGLMMVGYSVLVVELYGRGREAV